MLLPSHRNHPQIDPLPQPIIGESIADNASQETGDSSPCTSGVYGENHSHNGVNADTRCSGQQEPDTAHHDQYSSTRDGNGSTRQACCCLACRKVEVEAKKRTIRGHYDNPTYRSCSFRGCSADLHIRSHKDLNHERAHYQKPGNAALHCLEYQCGFTTQRFPDLVRHSAAKHCTSP